jgi:hypothetical protein
MVLSNTSAIAGIRTRALIEQYARLEKACKTLGDRQFIDIPDLLLQIDEIIDDIERAKMDIAACGDYLE